MSDKKSALGKGLDALLSLEQDYNIVAQGSLNNEGKQSSESVGSEGVTLFSLQLLEPNPDQPRTYFDEESLKELADSIQQRGVIQPILIEKSKAPGRFQIIAGERRYRAAKLAGLEKIPAIVRDLSHEEKLEIALIENIQRENLSPLEEAKAYRRIMEELHITQQEVAERVGKNRSTVANSLRLLKLPEEIQLAINDGDLSAGHARAVLSLVNPADQSALYRLIKTKGLSVRETESLATDWNNGKKNVKDAGRDGEPSSKMRDPDLVRLEESLIEKLGTKVQIKGSPKKGTIEIAFYSSEDLQRVLDIVTG